MGVGYSPFVWGPMTAVGTARVTRDKPPLLALSASLVVNPEHVAAAHYRQRSDGFVVSISLVGGERLCDVVPTEDIARGIVGKLTPAAATAKPDRTRLLTPVERAAMDLPGPVWRRYQPTDTEADRCAQVVATDRADVWEKACKLPRYIAVQRESVPDRPEPGRVLRGDWNCIALEDLEKLLEPR